MDLSFTGLFLHYTSFIQSLTPCFSATPLISFSAPQAPAYDAKANARTSRINRRLLSYRKSELRVVEVLVVGSDETARKKAFLTWAMSQSSGANEVSGVRSGDGEKVDGEEGGKGIGDNVIMRKLLTQKLDRDLARHEYMTEQGRKIALLSLRLTVNVPFPSVNSLPHVYSLALGSFPSLPLSFPSIAKAVSSHSPHRRSLAQIKIVSVIFANYQCFKTLLRRSLCSHWTPLQDRKKDAHLQARFSKIEP